MKSKASKAAYEMDKANDAILKKAPVCGNCDQYVDRLTLNKRYRRSEMLCRLNGKHMNPLLYGCQYHQANRQTKEIRQLTEGGFING